MRIKSQCHKFIVMTTIMMLMTLCIGVISASAQSAVLKKKVNVYAQASKKSAIITVLNKGATINVASVKGNWACITSGDDKGYVAKSAIKTSDGASSSGKKVTCQQMQNRLVAKGYLKSSAATGSKNAATNKAVRIFQMINGLGVNGNANASTIKKIMSGSAKKMPTISSAKWSNSSISGPFPKRGCATVIDLSTGKRFKIRRVGGHNHLDVEPKTAADTATLKKVYGGSWSWDSRPILLIAGKHYYAAAMNGMPHGAQINKKNNFNGQFCIHLNGSTTHGTEKANAQHQNNVDKVVEYFD